VKRGEKGFEKRGALSKSGISQRKTKNGRQIKKKRHKDENSNKKSSQTNED
jgi:hypothetical protein